MLENRIIEPSCSEWASPCVLVDKVDESIWFCTDYRKVNQLTRIDAYPIPQMGTCIDRIRKAKYITKCNLLKGYWAVPLSKRDIKVFVIPEGSFQYCVMPFGMKNPQATFSQINQYLHDDEGVDTYVDDIVVYNDSCQEHVSTLGKVFNRLRDAN